LLNNKYNAGKFDISTLLKEEYLIIDTRQSDLRLFRNCLPTLRNGRLGLLYVRSGKLHKLTGYESLLLQGFNKEVALKVKGTAEDRTLQSLAGNAMTVTVIEQLGRLLKQYLELPSDEYEAAVRVANSQMWLF